MSFVATLQKNLLKERRRLKLLWLALVLSISLCHQAAFASALSQLAASLQPGQFAELTGMTNFNGGDALLSFGSGCGLGDYVTEYANKAVWNPISKRFQFEGAPHGNCSVDQLVIYDEATNAWSFGTPAISGNGLKHSYDHNAINPATGDHYYRPYNSKSVFKLPNGGSWSSIASVPMSSIQCCGALEWFPDQGRLIFIDGDWGGWSYDPGSNSWTHLFRTNGNDGSGLPQYPMASYTNFAEYSKLGFIVFGGGQNIYKMNSSGTVSTIASAPFGNVNIGTGSTCCSIAADPVTGDIVVIDGSRRVWKLNPSSGTWTNTGIVAPAYFSQNVGVGESLISAPISAYGVIMYVKCDDASSCKVYLYKHTASTSGGGGTTPADTQAPTAPTNPTATVVGSSQINLSWSASTDNVGVTGYSVEQCQGSGCSNFSQIATPSGTTLNTTGLSASTSYSYRVRATDAAGNMSGYSTVVSATTQASATADTQVPTVPTSLAATVFSSSQINLTWTASTDNVGVTGYRVERCQASGCSNFAQLTTSPGTTFTDAGLSASTSYSYRVRATDAAGNLSGYSMVVSATTLGGGTGSSSLPTSDFATRCAAPGVLRCMGFDNPADLNFGTGGFNGGYGYNFGYLPSGANYSNIALDSSVKSDGASSLRFTVPSNSGGSASGAFFLNFTNPASGYQVGPGQDVYIQWRNRFSQDQINTIYWGELSGQSTLTLGATSGTGVSATLSNSNSPNFSNALGRHIYMNLGSVPAGSTGAAVVTSVIDSTHAIVDITSTFNKLSYPIGEWTNDWGQSSWKIVDISAGDLPSCTPGSPSSATCPTTCWDFETVVTNNAGGARGFPTVYANCGGPNAYQGLTGTNAPSGVTYQNVLDCPYPKPSVPPCFPLVADEWITFQAHIHVGTWGTASSTFRLWGARQGQPSVLIIECSPTIAAPHKCGSPYTNGVNYFNSNPTYKIGKLWLIPYQTGKSFQQTHPVGYVWYDEIIISTQQIADPSGSTSGTPSAPVAPSALTVK